MLGALTGDTIGSAYEFHNTKEYDFPLFDTDSNYTDDSVMTMAVAYWLLTDQAFADVSAFIGESEQTSGIVRLYHCNPGILQGPLFNDEDEETIKSKILGSIPARRSGCRP